MTAPIPDDPSLSPLQAECERIRKLLSDADLDDAFARYSVGAIIRRVKRDPDTYGPDAIVRLEQTLPLGKTSLYRIARVVESWDEPAFLALLERRTRSGATLKWGHFEVISEVKDEKEREFLLDAAYTTDLSVRELGRLVRARRPARSKAPRTHVAEARGALARFADDASTLVERGRRWEAEVVQPLRGVVLDKELGELVDRCHRVGLDLTTVARDVVGRLQQMRTEHRRG